jgi:predicted component of type VI protein secretion system
MPVLILNFPEGETTTIAVEREIVTLGRARQNDISIPERHVSSVHAEFRRRPDGAYELVDLGSLNGTFVNGLRLTERHGLHEGDRIVFGLLEAKFLQARPALAHGEEQQLTRGVEIDLIRAATAIRENPHLAQAAAELNKQVAEATGQGVRPPAPTPPAPARLQPNPPDRIPVATPAPVRAPMVLPSPPAPPAKPVPVASPAPAHRPTIQMVTPTRTGRNRPVILEVQSQHPASTLAADDRAPDSFLPSQPRSPSPFSVAPADAPAKPKRPG